jgi:hypothetical protein
VTYLSKEDIFKRELPQRDVEVPEWGGIVRVRALSGSDRDEYDASMLRAQPDGTVLRVPGSRAKLVSLAVVKDNGDPMFNVGDIGRLGLQAATALDRVVNAVVELSGLTDTAVEELEGNSDAAPSGDSGSTSPEN